MRQRRWPLEVGPADREVWQAECLVRVRARVARPVERPDDEVVLARVDEAGDVEARSLRRALADEAAAGEGGDFVTVVKIAGINWFNRMEEGVVDWGKENGVDLKEATTIDVPPFSPLEDDDEFDDDGLTVYEDDK